MTNAERLAIIYKHCDEFKETEALRLAHHPDYKYLVPVMQASTETVDGFLWDGQIVNLFIESQDYQFGYFDTSGAHLLPPTAFSLDAVGFHPVKWLLLRTKSRFLGGCFPFVLNVKLAKGIVRACLWNSNTKDYFKG